MHFGRLQQELDELRAENAKIKNEALKDLIEEKKKFADLQEHHIHLQEKFMTRTLEQLHEAWARSS